MFPKNFRVLAALAVTAGLAFAGAAQAQMSVDVELQKAEMAKLDGMVGVWEGSGSIAMGGPPEAFTQTERVQFKGDGLLLLIEGRGLDEDGAVKHDALAVASFDEASGEYRIRAYANGRAGTYPMVWLDNGDLRWTITAGGTQIRYTITLGENTWREVGEFQTPEGGFVQFLEFDLTRVGDAG